MKTCKTCKHWFTKRDVILPGRGICLKTTSVSHPNRSTAVTFGDEESKAVAMATADGALGIQVLMAGLETTAEFSCNQHPEWTK